MIPGADKLPRGSSRDKVTAWWVGMLENNYFASALFAVSKMPFIGGGVSEVTNLITTATAEQLDAAIEQLQTDLANFRSDNAGELLELRPADRAITDTSDVSRETPEVES